MSQDTSKHFAETERFLDSRLSDVMKVGGFIGALTEWADYSAHSTVNVLRSKGMRV